LQNIKNIGVLYVPSYLQQENKNNLSTLRSGARTTVWESLALKFNTASQDVQFELVV
jgi:hypothetical protein